MTENNKVKESYEYYEEAHKELHKKIWNCKDCCPISPKEVYCENCIKTVINFMNKYGAGVLTNDLKIEYLMNKSSKLEKENNSIKKQLQEKIKRVEELKKRLEEN